MSTPNFKSYRYIAMAAAISSAAGCARDPTRGAMRAASSSPPARQAPAQTENLRVWNRAWHDVALTPGQPLTLPLRFSFVPSRETWRRPGGSVGPATGTGHDIAAAGHEVLARIAVGHATNVELTLCGRTVSWDAASQLLDGRSSLPAPDGVLTLHVAADPSGCRVLGDDGSTILSQPAAPILDSAALTLAASGGAARVDRLDLWGLRGATLTAEEARLATLAAADNRVFYRSRSYTIFGSRVEDDVYGPPAASVPDRDTIVSPTRVTEGFELDLDRWRPHPMGRVIDHQTIWHPSPGIARFPLLKTDWPTVDAAYRVALDVLHRSSTDEFAADEDDRGKWQAGFFMGPKFGFGIWMRDSTHTALRAGNMIDPKVARATLIRITRSGIDNGCDGVLMPIVGLWDYYLVTGDASALRETWGDLKAAIAKIDAQFDPERGLVRAAHSTSNDAFSEPESGGFALGTEAYFMLAYQAMAEMGPIMNEAPGRTRAWQARADLLRANIRKLYWSDAAGHFTTGPKGSEGYARGDWESAGQELAIWPRFDVASAAQRRRVLDRLPDVAMNEFGVDVFPYRPETNHFCGAGWVVWTTGIAAAANREGRLDLLQHLIGQQVRNALMNKTFYEAIDCASGRAWRWPGQLWQAAGFLSYFHSGLLGMEFAQRGLTFHAAIPEPLANMRLSNVPYRQAKLDVTVKGWGTAGETYLDGTKVEVVPPNLIGPHTVELRMSPTSQDSCRPPVVLRTGRLPVPTRGWPGLIDCETMRIVAKSDDFAAEPQDMSPWGRERWSNGSQLTVKATHVGDFVELAFPSPDDKPRQIFLRATRAPDFGTLKFRVCGQPSLAVLDGYAPNVQPAPPLDLGVFLPKDGRFVLRAQVVGTNPRSSGSRFFFGLDGIELKDAR